MIRKLTIAALLVLSLTACVSHDDAQRALKSAGMTNIQTGGYGWFACSEDDTFATKFTATNPNGQRVSGVVCSAWLKGSTIRYD